MNYFEVYEYPRGFRQTGERKSNIREMSSTFRLGFIYEYYTLDCLWKGKPLNRLAK